MDYLCQNEFVGSSSALVRVVMLSSIGVNLAVCPELDFLRSTDVTMFVFIDKGVVQKYFQPIYASDLLLML